MLPAWMQGEPRAFRLERYGQGPLTFSGWIAAHVSSRSPSKSRWTEIRIYWRDDDDTWVGYVRGCSMVPGEVTLLQVYECASAQHLIAMIGSGPLAVEAYEKAGLMTTNGGKR